MKRPKIELKKIIRLGTVAILLTCVAALVMTGVFMMQKLNRLSNPPKPILDVKDVDRLNTEVLKRARAIIDGRAQAPIADTTDLRNPFLEAEIAPKPTVTPSAAATSDNIAPAS